MNVTVLGAGLVGSAIVRYLVKETDFSVTAVDLNVEALDRLEREGGIRTIRADLREKGAVESVVSGSGMVICAVPGFMGFETVKQIIKAGKNVVDISFFNEDPFLLDDVAKAKGVSAVVDCGVAPGLCNILAGHVDTMLDRTDRYVCYVGGLPVVRRWPYEYRAVFSPADVLEEYTRPCRLREYGQDVVRPALSDMELVDFPELGTLEAFNTDGLRSLRRTMDIPFMKEKTLRYPGHADLMRVFRESGFFSPAPVELDGGRVSPLALTSKLLFEQWKLAPGEEDVTVMKVVMEGKKGNEGVRYTYDLLDRYDHETRTTSMARTTGYTCAIIAGQMANGLFARIGICPPEWIGRTRSCYEDLLAGYERQGIGLKETVVSRGLSGVPE